jgi:hypothetical protein
MGGGGSELLIASVFEAGPPMDLTQATSKKASRQATKSGSDAEASDSESSDDKAESLATVFAMGGSKNKRKKGSGSTEGSKSRTKGADGAQMSAIRDENGNQANDEEEVQRLKHELKMVRESQLRTEEMIAKLLSSPK